MVRFSRLDPRDRERQQGLLETTLREVIIVVEKKGTGGEVLACEERRYYIQLGAPATPEYACIKSCIEFAVPQPP